MAILNFMTQFPGKTRRTNFDYKIVKGLYHHGKISSEKASELTGIQRSSIVTGEQMGKVHTIRLDAKNKWRVGRLIHFYIHSRTKKAQQFAPVFPVKSLQTISFVWEQKPEGYHVIGTPVDRVCTIRIDDRFVGDAYFNKSELISGTPHIEELAINDGFDTVEDFFEWFKEDFSGKIIHWTNLKY